ETKPRGQPRHVRLVVVQRQVQPLGDRFEGGTSRLGTSAAYQDGLVGVAVQCCTKLLRVAATMPQVIEQVQGDVTVQRGDGGALWHPSRRRDNLSVLLSP